MRKIDDHFVNDIAVNYDQMTIEHIAPEHPKKPSQITDDHVAQLGNLLLVSSELNKKLANKSFTKKMEILKNSSNIYIDDILMNSDAWNINKIDERTKIFSKLAFEKIWKI